MIIRERATDRGECFGYRLIYYVRVYIILHSSCAGLCWCSSVDFVVRLVNKRFRTG